MTPLAQRLASHLNTLARDIGERHLFAWRRLDQARAFIGDQLSGAGYAVTEQRFAVRGKHCANVIAERTGTRPSAGLLLVGAHYDTVPGCPGADDNGTGVAALIEIARSFAELNPEMTLRCVAFVNEEPPFFFTRQCGSRVYAEAARARGERIHLMCSLEMLGCYNDREGSQAYPPLLSAFYPSAGNFLAFVSNLPSAFRMRRLVSAFRHACDVPARALAAPAFMPGVARSDHLPFWYKGYRAVMVTDTADYRYPHYHTPEDTPDKIDLPRFARVTEGLTGAFARITRAGAHGELRETGG